MGRKILTYSAGLIALYLVVASQTNFGEVITSVSSGANTVVKAFQGRS